MTHHNRLTACWFAGRHAILLMVLAIPTQAVAIPSPELVIGSVSSLSQFLAVAFAMLSGAGAFMASRFGFKPRKPGAASRYPKRLVAAMGIVVVSLAALNYWQYTSDRQQELNRLQSTLVRPARFDGTEIKDENLKEASYVSQSDNPLAITTDEAQLLLAQTGINATTRFFDIRESAENQMGTLPGATHVRFPDFLQSENVATGGQVVLFCHNGNRSSETCEALAARGVDCRFIAGGIEKWIVEGREFSDVAVKELSDLRAIPEYDNKDTLISTDAFKRLQAAGDLQIVDTRYPGDFEAGHLPGAINIPIRALPTDDLNGRIAALAKKPTIAACYDRRSCFMAQVLGLELTRAGIPFEGRYTTPWDYFIPPKPKPHVQAWLIEQNTSIWQKAAVALAEVLLWMDRRYHLVLGLFCLALVSRILVLPVALKSERDQITTKENAAELDDIKVRFAKDPTRKARAIQQFHAEKGLTPLRNMTALLFLPVMMVGLRATELSSVKSTSTFLWLKDLGQADPTFVFPGLFSLFAGVYLFWAVERTREKAWLWLGLGVPALFFMVHSLSAASNIYLSISLFLLLLQRSYVVGWFSIGGKRLTNRKQSWSVRHRFGGVVPLSYVHELSESGNKSFRLSVLKNAGIPVPDGVVMRSDAIAAYADLPKKKRKKLARRVWKLAGRGACAVRSSAASEDGAEQSFAGVFDSVLDVRKKGMRKALDAVVASFSSQRAASYENCAQSSHDGNILIQKMVDADFAGVLFTQDPLAPGLSMIELIEGNGEDLVSGRKTPVSLRFGRYSGRQIAEEQAPIDLAPLLELGRKIEATFGQPQDIEWAHASGEFFIVQSRDITTLEGGSASERTRIAEWHRVFSHFRDAPAGRIILEKDELSEVLPEPTELSFSLMASLWSPGGSVDLACRQLGVRYSMPEGSDGHLFCLFGRTYVDRALKDELALTLSGGKAAQMKSQAPRILKQYREETVAELHRDLEIWQALDFRALPLPRLIDTLAELKEKFVCDTYVEAEKINILAGFLMTEARRTTNDDTAARKRLMQPASPHAPANLAASCLDDAEPESALLYHLGHRAMFDYELSLPRYCEDIRQLDPLRELAAANDMPVSEVPEVSGDGNIVDLALAFQDLKEQAKHESLRLFALIRKAVLAVGEVTGLDDLVFHLDFETLLKMDVVEAAEFRERAIANKTRNELLRKQVLRQNILTIEDCEFLSLGGHAHKPRSVSGEIAGTCVSGSEPARGRVFSLIGKSESDKSAFDGFQDGDILVCSMVSPAWLQQVVRAGAVLSEIGGWLSHMAIVAREKDVLMLVGCNDLDSLEVGATVAVGTDGSVSRESTKNDNVQSEEAVDTLQSPHNTARPAAGPPAFPV